MTRFSDKLTRSCECCGKQILISEREIKRGRGRFFSIACHNHARAVPLADRFFGAVGTKTEGGCVLWSGAVTRDGYGIIGSGGNLSKCLLASRVSYELMVGKIPAGLHVLHRCDNPRCINPIHLFVGSHAENMADKVKKGRHARGERIGHAKLTGQQISAIRERYSGGEFQASLAAEFGVSQSAISLIVSRRRWAN